MALTALATAAWAWVLLDRTPQWHLWLRPLTLAGVTIAAIGVLAASYLWRFGHRVTTVAAALAAVACLAGPVAYSAQTLSSAHTGSIVSAGPGGAGSGAGGQSNTSGALVKGLQADASRSRWVAAVSGSQSAASLELATGGEPVMAIGGFDDQGGNLTLTQFKQYVARGQIHHYISTTNGGAPAGGAAPAGGSASASGQGAPSTNAITSRVKAHYKTVRSVVDRLRPRPSPHLRSIASAAASPQHRRWRLVLQPSYTDPTSVFGRPAKLDQPIQGAHMTLAITLNIILATIVVTAIVGLLAAAITTSRDSIAVTTASSRAPSPSGSRTAPEPALSLI